MDRFLEGGGGRERTGCVGKRLILAAEVVDLNVPADGVCFGVDAVVVVTDTALWMNVSCGLISDGSRLILPEDLL